MPKPTEHKTVQDRILAYAEAILLRQDFKGQIGWITRSGMSQEESDQWRGFDPETPFKQSARGHVLFFEDLLNAMVREFNSNYAGAEGALPGKFRHLHTDIYCSWEFVEHQRNRGQFFSDLMTALSLTSKVENFAP